MEASPPSLGAHSSPSEKSRTRSSYERSLSQPEPESDSPLGLSKQVLQHLLDEYRKRQAHFPFVVVLDEWTPASMAAERPFLLLAVITCACSQRLHLQAALAAEFRKTLATRVIVNGEKSLDLLQGLLVHLSWYILKLHCREKTTNQLPGFISTAGRALNKHTNICSSPSAW